MALAVKNLKPVPNETILNAIRKNASSDYQRRIPAATKANMQDQLANLTNPQNRALWNEFTDALLNRIGLVIGQSKSWTNPLAEFKIGMLPFGSTIEEYQVGLIEAMSYDADREHLEQDIFGRADIDVQSSFHSINRRDVYKITINQQQLKAAFLEPLGLSNFVNDLMAAPANSDQWDEFLLMCNLFSEYEKNGGFFRVQIPEVSSIDSDTAAAKRALRVMRGLAETMKFPSTLYNAAGMPTWINPDELVIFTSPEFKAAIDVEALSAAFNMDRANIESRIITVPKDKFGIADCEAIITSSKFFMVADTHYEMASSWNPRALHNNYFLHHWQIISASRFVPAVMLTTGEGTIVDQTSTPVTDVSAITVTDRENKTVTEVKRGQIYNVAAKAITDPADGDNDAVRYSVSNPTSSRTFITNEGVLYVGPDEESETLTLTAVATWIDPENPEAEPITETKSLTVSGDIIVWWPVPAESAETV